MNKIKILTLFSTISLITSTAHAKEFDLVGNISDFYKIYNVDTLNSDYLKAQNHILNFEEAKQELEIRNIIDYIDYCADQNNSYKIACFSILAKSGHYDSLRAVAGEFYELSQHYKTYSDEAQMKYLIFSAKKLGIAEGFKKIDLTQNAPYRSFRITFEDLKESDSLEGFSDTSFLDDFYNIGIYESINFNLSNLYGNQKKLNFEDLNFEIDIDKDTIELIENGDFMDIFNELREIITNEEGINYLIRKASNEEYEDIFVSLLRGDNGFPEEHSISVFTLFDQGVNKNNHKALYYLIQEAYRRHILNRNEEGYNDEYLNDTILLSAILKNNAPYFKNEVFDLLLFNNNDYLNFIQNFNKIRKDYLN